MDSKIKPRGIRNNNPLNIRKGSNWIGERHPQSDKAFEEFQSLEYGVRAGFLLLRKYMSGYHGLTRKFDTINLIIRRWAPPTENSTQRYIDYVARDMGMDPNTHFDFKDKRTMCNLVAAMIKVECGQEIDRQIIESAYDMV